MEAKEVIKEGVRWIVGNGNDIDILDRPWLNDSSNPYITSTSEAFHNNKVSSLMRMDCSGWDYEIIIMKLLEIYLIVETKIALIK